MPTIASFPFRMRHQACLVRVHPTGRAVSLFGEPSLVSRGRGGFCVPGELCKLGDMRLFFEGCQETVVGHVWSVERASPANPNSPTAETLEERTAQGGCLTDEGFERWRDVLRHFWRVGFSFLSPSSGPLPALGVRGQSWVKGSAMVVLCTSMPLFGHYRRQHTAVCKIYSPRTDIPLTCSTQIPTISLSLFPSPAGNRDHRSDAPHGRHHAQRRKACQLGGEQAGRAAQAANRLHVRIHAR